VGRKELASAPASPAARLTDQISISSALNSSTVFHMIKTGRKVAGAGALTLLFAVWAPGSVFACSSGTSSGGGGTYGGGSAAGGGSAIATGGGSAVPVGSIGFGGMTFAALSGFVLLAAVVVLAILLVKTLRRPRPNWALMAQLSPDGRYWWDGTAWHDGLQNPPPPSVRSADGAHWWDGGSWRLVPTS
jgi:hypothetical protein